MICESCGEETIYISHDLLDWTCAVCGGCACRPQEGPGRMLEKVKRDR